MAQAAEAVLREELRRASLPGQGMPARLLALLRAAPETHLGLAEAYRMAADAGFALTATELALHLDGLVDLGLLGRLPSTGAEPVYDTVPEPHSHLVYEATAQVVDLHVSAETLLAILRHALAERPAGVEILVRFRRGAPGRNPDGMASVEVRRGAEATASTPAGGSRPMPSDATNAPDPHPEPGPAPVGPAVNAPEQTPAKTPTDPGKAPPGPAFNHPKD